MLFNPHLVWRTIINRRLSKFHVLAFAFRDNTQPIACTRNRDERMSAVNLTALQTQVAPLWVDDPVGRGTWVLFTTLLGKYLLSQD
jgi:hypothetical protein